MNPNQETIETFYSAFSSLDPEGMISCYHKDVVFEDPAFGILHGNDVALMWQMLIERSKGNLKIAFFDIKANPHQGSAKWVATYTFSQTNRKVINEISAEFEFRDGLIIRHKDHFDIWKWSRQALGLKGLLLGWTTFMKQKIQQQARLSLEKYRLKSNR